MNSEWTKSTLGEFVRLQRGHDLTASEQMCGSVPVMGSAGPNGTHSEARAKGPGVVIGRSGASIGRVHYSDVDFWPHNTCLYVTDFMGNSPLFSFYLLQTLNLAAFNSGSAQPSLNRNFIYAIPVFVPGRQEQDNIVELLRALDDRITLLRETNATLEAIAQALFKSWFVDFDPVYAKQQGIAPVGMDEATAALFPGSFESTEWGPSPTGWHIKTLGEVCSVTIGGLWGKDDADSDLVQAISLRGVDLEQLRSDGFAKDAPLRWAKPAAIEKRRLSESEVLVASSGAGPCGRPLWAGGGFEAIYQKPVMFSNFVKRLECRTSAMAIYVDRLLADMRESKEIWNYINGTSVPNLDDKLLLETKRIAFPSHELLLGFEDFVRAIYRKRYSQEVRTLVTLRDTLLPRLISGQLRIPDAEALLQ
ncbi:restriction endonuclease subunit S [Variovorax rhizosphaerae]|uniref:Restriction endonuclease subunit S n=1 Tax=Variovorax rhizosphaerae TaxID=1836200 RepID=A0ABU8WU87_9BURK